VILRFAIAALLGTAAAFAAQSCGGHGGPETLLVSTDWLAAHLHDPKLVVLEVGDRVAYDRTHIPGAGFLRYQDLSSRLSPLTLELPPMNELADTFGALGVSNDSRVVIYVGDGGRVIQATRVLLTLDAMGLGAQSSLLDGGLAAWQSQRRAVSTEAPAVKRGTITPCPQTDIIVDSAYVSSNLRHRGVDIVDARAPEFYSGQSTSTGKRAGHIPGAANLPFSTMVDAQGKLLPPAALREMFQHAGIQPGDRVVSYCHIGLQATMVYFTARYLGYDARLYDGSWEDWSAHTELPAETAAHN
jgi:thiosulfate/3-mercaptopyruvate sulfurtransferase